MTQSPSSREKALGTGSLTLLPCAWNNTSSLPALRSSSLLAGCCSGLAGLREAEHWIRWEPQTPLMPLKTPPNCVSGAVSRGFCCPDIWCLQWCVLQDQLLNAAEEVPATSLGVVSLIHYGSPAISGVTSKEPTHLWVFEHMIYTLTDM